MAKKKGTKGAETANVKNKWIRNEKKSAMGKT